MRATKIAVLFLTLALMPVLPYSTAGAEMYAEIYGGGVQAASESFGFTTQTAIAPLGATFNNHVHGRLDPAFLGGLKLGTWFVKEGFLGYNYPNWMKYLGFYLDFSFHRLDFRNQDGASRARYTLGAFGPATALASNTFFSEGTAVTLSFMFAGRYGFLPDSEMPFGRLQPYLAVGPAILFTSQEPQLTRNPHRAVGGNLTVIDTAFRTISPGSDSTAVICLAADAGIRYMALKNVSIDAFFRYRYAEPSFSYDFADPLGGCRGKFSMRPTYHLFSGQLGVAYHF